MVDRYTVWADWTGWADEWADRTPRQRSGRTRRTNPFMTSRGVPCIRGLRIPAATVVGMIADGMTPDEIVAELPPLELDDVSAALRFAADAVADREIPLQPTA